MDKINILISCHKPIEWKEGLEPYYPINDDRNNALYEQYKAEAQKLKNIYFGGRLGQYKYFDMDKTIESALNLINEIEK